jgi:alpha-1,6-mannosyl-glycoprotein beta-1,2-N-acetylglucosaminyltransferase
LKLFITFEILIDYFSGECGVHHKKQNCDTTQIISKVQQVLNAANKAGHFYPKNLMLTVSSVVKKQKLKKPNGGFGDKRDHLLCMNMTLPTR